MADKSRVRLTALSTKGGCAAKWGPGDLACILAPILKEANKTSPFAKDLLLGFETSDDAAVLKISDDLACVLTVDFLTPLVDDPFDFGRVAATNAISDVYAMGATPVCALNVLALDCKLGNDVASEILKGGADAAAAAGALIVGGHSVDDPEPKYGLCVLGIARPGEIIRNEGARAGDVLYLTKRLGVGLLSAAYKIGEIDEEGFICAVDSMTTLNKAAASAMVEAEAHAATDVTGFGLAGHLHEMLASSKVSAQLDWQAIPLFDRAWDLACAYCRPNRTFSIMDFASSFIEQGTLDDEEFDNRMAVVCDPQTSGGLLVALPVNKAEIFETAFFREAGYRPWKIGRFVEDPSARIRFADA